MPTGNNTTLSVGSGIGYSGSYLHTSIGEGSGFITSFNPFVDIQHKWFYNFDKRKSKGLKTANNAGNFVSARFLTRSESLFGNSNGTDGLDFAVGPTWVFNVHMVKTFIFCLIWDLFIILILRVKDIIFR